MWKTMMTAAATLAVIGIGAPVTDAAAQARPKPKSVKGKKTPPRPSAYIGDRNSGGPSSCYNPYNMSASARATMERLGGTPCADAVPVRRAAPAATVTATADWIVGAWSVGGKDCGAPDLILNVDGTYDGMQFELGRWSYTGTTLTLTALEQYERGRPNWAIPYPKPINYIVGQKGSDGMNFMRPGNPPSALTRCVGGRPAVAQRTQDEVAEPGAASMDRRFPTGERVTLAFEPAGMGGTGTITHRAPGQRAKTVTIGYMSEFTGIVAPNRVRFGVVGTTDQGQQRWACEVTIDWRTAKVIAVRDLSPGFDHPACEP